MKSFEPTTAIPSAMAVLVGVAMAAGVRAAVQTEAAPELQPPMVWAAGSLLSQEVPGAVDLGRGPVVSSLGLHSQGLASAAAASMPGTESGSADLDRLPFSAIPEPTTLLAGALLLAPFGVSTLRSLLKARR